MKVRLKPFRPVYPSPAALVTSVDAADKPNIITLGEVFNISIREPVIVGIAIRPATYSHSLIRAAGEYVVNFPTAAIVEKVDRCGTVSGRSGVDKFAAFGLTPLPAAEVRPPLIKECPVNLECRVIGMETIGDHDLFKGEVLALHVDEDKTDGAGNLLAEKLDVLAYLNSEYWSLGQRLGRHGFSSKRE